MSKKLTEQEEFDKYFDEAMASEGERKPDPIDETEDDPKEEETFKQETEDQLEQEPEPEPEPESEPEPEKNWEAEYEKIRAELEKAEHRMSSWEGRISKANERAKAAEDELAKLKASKEKEPSEDDTPTIDDEVLKEFQEEFPDLVKPLTMLAKKYAEQIADERLGKVAPTIEEIQKRQQQSAVDLFFEPIYAAHPDWKDLFDSGQLQEWIATLPPLQQRVFNEVVDNGSQPEIIEMFDAYKKAKGLIRETDKSANLREAHQDLNKIVAVQARSGGPPDSKKVDKNDYIAGWNDAISQG